MGRFLLNAIGSPWCHLDLAALAASGREVLTAVLPKVEHAGDLAFADRLLAGVEAAAARTTPIRLLALIETPAGLAEPPPRSRARRGRSDALVLGYADPAAGARPARRRRRVAGLASCAQETPARRDARGRGHPRDRRPAPRPRATTAALPRRRDARPATLGFDGKWAIHPAQLDALREAFTPTAEEVAGAREVLAALELAAAGGAGAVSADGQMLDEALALSARRLLARAGDGR